MSAHDTCTLEEFKHAVADFTKEAPTASDNALEQGWRAITRVYLGIPTDTLTLLLAKGYLEFATKRYWDRRMELDGFGNPLEKLKAMLA